MWTKVSFTSYRKRHKYVLKLSAQLIRKIFILKFFHVVCVCYCPISLLFYYYYYSCNNNNNSQGHVYLNKNHIIISNRLVK